MAAKNIGKSFLNQKVKELKKNPGRVNITSLARDYLSLMDQNHVYEDAESFLANLYQVSIVRYFPQNFELNEKYDSSECKALDNEFLTILSTLLKLEESLIPFCQTLHFQYASPEDSTDSSVQKEYLSFLKVLNETHLYAFFRIAVEITPFNTLGHVAGVHHVAMTMGRQLKELNCPVDLALLSAAAALHDIGKFGCRKNEARRVPYLHYYYTETFMDLFDMPIIGHIAANHSTWDLELENLSVENLLLIYADFRVKSTRDEKGEHIMFYSLDDSYQVILDKLDNVDEKKKHRYQVVYAKLKDFENYMLSLGVTTDLITPGPISQAATDPALLSDDLCAENLKNQAIRHNIYVMSLLNNESSLNEILDEARTEKNSMHLRTYLDVFEEYCTYMTKKQKRLTLRFLSELLVHKEGDIRRRSATLIGILIAKYNQEYRKELPEDVTLPGSLITAEDLWLQSIRRVIEADYRTSARERRWMGYTLKRTMEGLLSNCTPGKIKSYKDILINFFRDDDYDEWGIFTLIDTATALPYNLCSRSDIETILDFTVRNAKRGNDEIKLNALRLCNDMIVKGDLGDMVSKQTRELLSSLTFDSKSYSIDYLVAKTNCDITADEKALSSLKKDFLLNDEVLSQLYLENLKTDTPWIFKLVNIRLIKAQVDAGSKTQIFHSATHLANLVKVSERVTVRKRAGDALITLMPHLSLDQRNEICIELLRGLEIGGYQYAKYVPDYLGQALVYLQPSELDEILNEFDIYLSSTSETLNIVTLKTVAVLMQHYKKYLALFPEYSETFESRRNRLLGMIATGLGNYKESVSLEALYILSADLIASNLLNEEEKLSILNFFHKKLVILLMTPSSNKIYRFKKAASLNHIYRFIASYLDKHGKMGFTSSDRVAFFPGTFDPFTNGHKRLVLEMVNRGYEVYLALDEFSWSKRTQPRLLRRQIVSMSIADLGMAYPFPDNIPVNIANPKDLAYLKSLFPGKTVSLVMGSDVIRNASAYKVKPKKDSVHHMDHIVFLRGQDDSDKILSYENLLASVDIIDLDRELEDVSSTKIRDNIDNDLDISYLINPMAQNFIYEHHLYMREPQNKGVIDSANLKFEILPNMTEELAEEFDISFNSFSNESVMVLRDTQMQHNHCILLYHSLSSGDLYKEYNDVEFAKELRKHVSGHLVVITGVFISPDCQIRHPFHKILTESLSWFLREEYSFGLCHIKEWSFPDRQALEAAFKRHGFKLLISNKSEYVSVANMLTPFALISNVESKIKAPFSGNPRVQDAIIKASDRLMLTLADLYPDSLIMSYDSNYIDHRMIELVTRENQVPSHPVTPRQLGKYMCVPFGDSLQEVVVPNTVTKALHTSRIYELDGSAYKIAETPNYSELITQVDTIRAFNRPVILADDTLHNAHRMQRLSPILDEKKVSVDKLIVGVMSGSGRDHMDNLNVPVESVYFIPNMRALIFEARFYPIIGGERIRTDAVHGMVQGINRILPFVGAPYLPQMTYRDYFTLSKVCIENAIAIMETLEEEYQWTTEHNLTVGRLYDVIRRPILPFQGGFVDYDLNAYPSSYLKSYEQQMIRTDNMGRIE